MFYLDRRCSICHFGVVGLYRCSDAKTIVFVCSECGTVWDDARIDEVGPIQFLLEADPPLPGYDCSLGGDVSGWATFEEIEAAELTALVAGEG